MIVEVTLTKKALTVVLSLPVGLSPDNIVKLEKEISYALGGKVDITTQGRAVYVTRWLIEMPTLVKFNPPDLSKYKLPIWLGKDKQNNDIVIDLTNDRTFALLVGGLPGTGKTNLIKSILAGWEETENLRITGVDLKGGVELNILKDHPCITHLAYEPEEVEPVVDYLFNLMKKREKLFLDIGIGDIAYYKGNNLERHVLLIDEYSDLTDQKNDTLQRKIFRIARRGRAFGIHTIICSQRLTSDCINTSLRNMFPCAICFRVAKREDSEAILFGHGIASELPDIQGRAIYMSSGVNIITIQTPLAPNY